MIRAYIGLGANLGDPIQQILDARRQLSNSAGVSAVESSALYLTTPVGYDDQADFVNCVCMVDTVLSSQQLFSVMQTIELNSGRQRDPSNRNAARVIDLDLLLYGNQNIDTDNLVVPHPRLGQRLFTLVPLLELAERLQLNDLDYWLSVLKQGQKDKVFSDQTIYRLT